MTTRRTFLRGTAAAAGLALFGLGCDDGGGVVPAPDATPDDGSMADGAPDAAATDSGAGPDAASPDAASPDAASPDAASPDAASPDGGAPDSGPLDCSRPSVTIDENHRGAFHTLDVPAADIAEGVERSYEMAGTDDHPHTVLLTVDDFATLAATGTVEVTSSTDASAAIPRHSHPVVIRCA